VEDHDAGKVKRTKPSDQLEADPAGNITAQSKSEKKSVGKKNKSTDSADALVVPVEGESKARGRGRPRRNVQGKETSKPSTTQVAPAQADEAENLEWVQCEKCLKWRKLPAHISADELPDAWYCFMNYWAPASASCDAPEDKADGLQDIGFHAGAGVGKLSYRNLIFG
jgi:hypothetical protein